MPPVTSERSTDRDLASCLELGRARALRFLRRLCGDDAEDVLQDALAKLWRHRAAWDPARTGDGWLLRAAFRAFLDWRRRSRRTPAPTDGLPEPASAQGTCRVELKEELERGLARLAPLERALLLGFHAEGRSLAELAKAHRLPLNTVKSHLHRARGRLAEALEHE